MSEIKTLEGLKNVLTAQMKEIEIPENIELFEELIQFIDLQIKQEKKAA